jgi:RimJ/RimL family protein N-acetyltransferase
MIDPPVHAALAPEQRDAPPVRRLAGHRPRPAGRAVVLRDGSPVLIRQIHAGDAPLVADIFDELSDTSHWMQFLAARRELSASELRYLTDVDHRDHEALAALDHAAGRGVGVARYIRHTVDPQAAEVAVTVVDGWQGRGLGTELLIQLCGRALQEGVGRFTAVASVDNAAAAGLLRTMHASLVSYEYGTVEYEINLAQPRVRSSQP